MLLRLDKALVTLNIRSSCIPHERVSFTGGAVQFVLFAAQIHVLADQGGLVRAAQTIISPFNERLRAARRSIFPSSGDMSLI